MSEVIEVKPRDVDFHLFVAATCIGAALVVAAHVAPQLIGYMLAAAAGGMNIGVVIESKRWERKRL